MRIKIRVKTKPKHENNILPWEDEVGQYKKMSIYMVSPIYIINEHKIKEYIEYQFNKNYIQAYVESEHLVFTQLVCSNSHTYTRRFKFSDIDSGKPVDGVYIFSNRQKAIEKKNELNDKLKKDNKICCVVMLTKPYKHGEYSITIQHEKAISEPNKKIDSTFLSTFRANEVFYLTEDEVKRYGIDELLKEANKKGE